MDDSSFAVYIGIAKFNLLLSHYTFSTEASY